MTKTNFCKLYTIKILQIARNSKFCKFCKFCPTKQPANQQKQIIQQIFRKFCISVFLRLWFYVFVLLRCPSVLRINNISTKNISTKQHGSASCKMHVFHAHKELTTEDSTIIMKPDGTYTGSSSFLNLRANVVRMWALMANKTTTCMMFSRQRFCNETYRFCKLQGDAQHILQRSCNHKISASSTKHK